MSCENYKQLQSRSVTVDKILKSSDGNSAKLVQITKSEGFTTIESGRYEVDGESVVCLSTQIGCGMCCGFCRSTEPFEFYPGQPKRIIRSLDSKEIVDQAINSLESVPTPSTSNGIIFSFMGMGEPFANIRAVKESIIQLGKLYPRSRATLSTIGFNLQQILQLGKEVVEGVYPIPIKLHISLHASNDSQRAKLMPHTSPILETVETAEKYAEMTGTRVKLNYVLVRGFNDTDADVQRLSELLKDRKGFVLKISDLNSTNQDAVLSSSEADLFESRLNDLRVETCRFSSDGQDILAGCGELVKGKTIPDIS
ncbi:MAG TPA: radical SAM protein [Spirochaetia bacterium]|nr:radical SAM protein [Spirochaetia bacterium]